MKRPVLYLLLGLLPLAFGFLQNWLLVGLNLLTLSYLTGPVFYVLWFILARLLHDPEDSVWKTTGFLNLPAAVFLLLALFQELALHRYLSGILGFAPQLYYLPTISIGFLLTSPFGSVAVAYTVCFLLMVAVALFGCWRKFRKSIAK